MKSASAALTLGSMTLFLGLCDGGNTTTRCTKYAPYAQPMTISTTTNTETTSGTAATTRTSCTTGNNGYGSPVVLPTTIAPATSISCTSAKNAYGSLGTSPTTNTSTACPSMNNEVPPADPTGASSLPSTASGIGSSKSTLYLSKTAPHVPVGPTGSPTSAQRPTPPFPLTNGTVTNGTVTPPTGANVTGTVLSWNTSTAIGTPSSWNTSNITTTTAIPFDGKNNSEATGEVSRDRDGRPLPIAFGLEALQTLFESLPYAAWLWWRLPEPGHPVTDSPAGFEDTVCTGGTVDAFEERRAARNLHYFCNRWQVPRERLYTSTSGMATLYLCSYGQTRNCSLDLWRAASAHLDRECGPGATGYVHLRKLRIGRERQTPDVTFCPRLLYSPLWDYRINQREVLVDGRPYEEWRILNRRKEMRKELAGEDINERNDAKA
ncbi:hypothetical protein IF1G_09252 [Cordyceps javanica]|uniref:Uncharacterized protein n=1 Tax=Cordyceps javanica TaxID=43265 RepID=A0A545URV1_9HYPO|nr:hypothetical protein IF1G_09252 [Cordyceps javanica]TQW04034.1 hypothetical protein IF2G_08348 [Cordyceps javanica]